MTTAPDPMKAERFAPHLTADRSRAALAGTLWSLLHTLIPTLSGTLVFYLSATLLTPSDFGRMAIALGVVSVALAVSPLAFAEALVQRKTLERSHADAVFLISCLYGLLSCLALIALAGPVARWFGEPDLAWLVPVVALKLPFDMIASVPNAMIVRSMRFRIVALRTAAATSVGAGVSIALLLLGHGLAALAVAQVAISLTTCAVALWSSGWRPGLSGQRSHLKDLLDYAIYAAGERMLSTLRVDHLVVGAMGGAALLGLLTFAQRIFRLLSDLAGGALGQVVHVLLASMQDEPDKARRSFALVSFASTAVGFPVFAGAAMVVDDLVTLLFPDKWSGATEATQIFCLAGFLTTLGIVQGAFIRSQGKANWWFWYQLVQQGTTVLAIVLTWRYGLTAIAAAVVAKSFLVWPVSVAMTIRLLECGLAQYARAFVGPLAATLGMILALWALPNSSGWTGVSLYVLAGAIVYPILLVALSRAYLIESYKTIRRKGAVRG